MKSKYITCILPLNKNLIIKTKLVEVPVHEKTIYDAVGFFEDEADKKVNLEYYSIKVKENISLREIINLHDENGLKLYKIKKMLSRLKTGNHIISKRGVPNIKLIKTKENKFLVFDGHHSILSYLLLGKEFLYEIPHMIIESESEYFEDKDVSVFFGKHKNKINKDDWRKYVINWNEPFSKQIVIRKRKNIGELYDAVEASIDF